MTKRKGSGIWMVVIMGILATAVASLVFYSMGVRDGKNSNKKRLATCLFELNQIKRGNFDEVHQRYKLDNKDLIKVRVVAGVVGEAEHVAERPWALYHKGEDHIVLQNDCLAFLPCRSWGAVLPYKEKESIDVTKLRGDGPEDLVLELHPDAWDEYIKNGAIDEDGNYIEKDLTLN